MTTIVRIVEAGGIVATGLVAMSIDSGWAGFAWGVLLALGGGLVWLLSLREQQNIASALAAERDKDGRSREAVILERLRSLESAIRAQHLERKQELETHRTEMHRELQALSGRIDALLQREG